LNMKNFLKLHKNKILSGGLLFLAALMALTGLYVWNLEHKPELQIYFFDVGQGDSIFIEAKDGTQILIDGGPTNKILPLLGGVMPFYDHSIDVVILTHPHADHVSGLMEVLKRYNVEMIFESGASYHTAEAKEFESMVIEKNIKKIIIDRPVKLSFFKNAALNFLFPDKSFEGQVLKNVHDSALISELDFEGKKILFMSDAEKNLERYLLQKGALEDIDVLKVGHHGSKTSSTADFLKIVKPEYAVISASDRNRYGHPHPDVLSRLSAIGAQIFRTDINGTIILNINNGRLTLQKEK